MQVLVNIVLMEGDELDMTPDEIADAVLKALGGDEEKDNVQSHVQAQPATGAAGMLAVPPPAELPAPGDPIPPEGPQGPVE